MQENEFEKQVKQRMDEFRLRPSEPVWTEIENELRKKRRRRFILIPLFAALLVAGYFAWQSYFPANKISSSAKEISIKNNDNTTKNKDADNQVNKNADKINETGNNRSSETTEKTPVSKNPKEISSPLNKPENVNNSESISKKEKNTESKSGSSKRESNGTTDGNNPVVSLKEIKKADLGKEDSRLVRIRKEKDIQVPHKNATDQDNRPIQMNNDLAQHDLPVELTKAEPITPNILQRDNKPVTIDSRLFNNNLFADSVAGNKIAGLQLPSFNSPDRLRSSQAIKFGISFSVGASSRVNKPLQVNSEDKSLLPSGQYASYSGGSFNNLGGGVSVLPPSEVKPGAAFKIGAIAMKPISKRLDISAGLQYVYASDHIRVGKSITSSLSPSSPSIANLDVLAQAYYPNVQNADFTNKYHFIELPVSVYFNLNRKWKAPFIWNAGVSASRLISSDVLLYDVTWGGIYYKGDNDIRKTQVNISTGFSIRFTGNNRWQWNIGPQVYMGMTKLFQSEYEENKHPVYGGLNVQILFPGKKR